MIITKTLRQLCEAAGVTRRTIQWYESKGLLHWTEKNSTNLLYDEVEEAKLYFIQTLLEAGYNLNEIKTILKSQDSKRTVENAIARLEQKKERIDGMIQLLTYVSMDNSLPKVVLQKMNSKSISSLMGGSYPDWLDSYINFIAHLRSYELSGIEFDSFVRFIMIYDGLIWLSYDYKPDDVVMQTAIKESIEQLKQIEDSRSALMELNDAQTIAEFEKGVDIHLDIYTDYLEEFEGTEEIVEALTKQEQEIKLAISIYKENLEVGRHVSTAVPFMMNKLS